MKRTVELVLMIIATIVSLIGIVFAVIFKAVSKSPDFKSGFEKSMTQSLQEQGNSDILNQYTPDQMIDLLNGSATYGLVVFIISVIFTIIAIFLVKKQRILAGVLTLIAAFLAVITFNIISFLLLIIAAIMLFVRKNKNNQFEETNFQNDHNFNQRNDNLNEEQNDRNFMDETEKKKKDDDPYIY